MRCYLNSEGASSNALKWDEQRAEYAMSGEELGQMLCQKY